MGNVTLHSFGLSVSEKLEWETLGSIHLGSRCPGVGVGNIRFHSRGISVPDEVE